MKNPEGRPSLYKEEYCTKLRAHMRKGGSFETFGAKIGVSRDRVYKWAEMYPEFAEAKKLALDDSLLFYEELALANFIGNRDSTFNTTLWIFVMKNRFKWRDKQKDEEDDDKKKENNPLLELLKSLPKEELLKLIKGKKK